MGQKLEQFECVIARAAADIKNVRCIRFDSRSSMNNQFQRERRIHCSGLPRFKIGEAFNVIIETLADLFDCRFHTF